MTSAGEGGRKKIAGYFGQYLEALHAKEPVGKLMDYDWGGLEGQVDLSFMPYSMMLDEFSRELTNIINELTVTVGRLAAWQEVIVGLEDNDKLEVISEFIAPLATIALNLPYVIRSRFIFATAHLSHQANQAKLGKSWVDDFPLDGDIYLEAAEQHSKDWKRFGKLKLSLEKMAGKAFRKATHDFRNAYNHRFSPRIELGLTGLVTRHVSTDVNGKKIVAYGVGSTAPLKITQIVHLLTMECEHCYKAYDHFKALVHEQEAAITEFSQKKSDGAL